MTSDSSEDENLDLLTEAVDTKFLNESMFTRNLAKSSEATHTQELPPSLRKSQEEDGQFRLFRVTPEFQNYVAKHLSSLLEKRLQKVLTTVDSDSIPTKKSCKSRVRLFKNSQRFLKVAKTNNDSVQHIVKESLVKRPQKLSFHGIDEADLQVLAVNPEDILSGKTTKFWSTRSKTSVFHYKQSSNGKLTLVEPQFK
ncbi:uncharacterized protein [Euwallacea similis]|uniref:uncharacterized protein isoform X1 n=1 Tax=Euwallacea similis TaxID=1736056 RepID=UPI00344FA634